MHNFCSVYSTLEVWGCTQTELTPTGHILFLCMLLCKNNSNPCINIFHIFINIENKLYTIHSFYSSSNSRQRSYRQVAESLSKLIILANTTRVPRFIHISTQVLYRLVNCPSVHLPKIAGNFSFPSPSSFPAVTGFHILAARRVLSFKVIQTHACISTLYMLAMLVKERGLTLVASRLALCLTSQPAEIK